MQTQITVEIFCGLPCYMLGNSRILNIGAHLPEAWLPHISLLASPCNPACKCADLTHAPYARVNGKMIANATVESVCEEIRRIVKEKEGILI